MHESAPVGPTTIRRRKLLTKINDLNRIVEVLKQGYFMVRNSTKLLVAGVVLGVMNQACAVHGGPEPGARKGVRTVRPAPVAAAVAPVVPAPPPARSDVTTTNGVEQPPAHAMAPLAARAAPEADPALAPSPDRPRVVAAGPDGSSASAVPPGLARAIEPAPPSPAVNRADPVVSGARPGSADTPVAPAPRAEPAPIVRTAEPLPAPASPASPQAPTTPLAQMPAPNAIEPVPFGPVDEFSAESALDEVAPHGSLWDRVRAGFKLDGLDSPLVSRYEEYYANRPDYLKRIVSRGKKYLHFIVEEVEKRGMPLEIALLPMIESAYNPTAYSKAHAAGMWQFIPTTGKLYGLQQNWWYDGRRDVQAATRAALDYLQKLYGDFGDWHLALAAYNWGEGAVSRAIERNQRQGLPGDYNSLRMPAETRNYVPKLLAVKNIVAEPEKYGLELDDLPNEPYFIRVAAPGHMDLQRAAQLAGVPVEELRSLNPGFNRPIITPANGDSLLVPADRAEAFTENLKSNEGPLLTWQTYRVERPERIEAIAQRFGTTPALLQQVNGVARNGRLKAGSTLLVPRTTGGGGRPRTLDVASFQPPELLPDTPRVHRVTRGETLRSIADRYDVDVRQLMAWNGLRSEKVRAGQRIALQARGKAVARTVAGKTHGPSAEPRAHRSESRAARAGTAAQAKTRTAAHQGKSVKPEKIAKGASASRKAVARDTRGKSASPVRKQQVAAGR